MISPQEYKAPSYKNSLYKHQSLERDVYNKVAYLHFEITSFWDTLLTCFLLMMY